MSKIFISHSSANNAAGLALGVWLDQHGWGDHFLDISPVRGLSPGERWQEALKAAADRCQAVLFAITPAWRDSKWCLAEFLLAKQLDKPIFGVIVEPTPLESLPAEITSEVQLCDLVTGVEREHFRVSLDQVVPQTDVSFARAGLERLRLGLQKAGIDASTFAWPPPGDPEHSPYPGLRALDAADAAVFFGRDADVVRGLDALRGMCDRGVERMLVILGASGSGKSSFLRAGILPRLKRHDRHFLPIPVVRPDRAALSGTSGLAASLEAAFGGLGRRVNRGEIRNRLNAEGGFGYLLGELQELARARLGPGAVPPTVVIPIDQGEELYGADGRAEADGFLALLASALGDPRDQGAEAIAARKRALVIMAIRSESYVRLQTEPRLERMKSRIYPLNPILRGEFKAVIEGPARRATEAGRKLTIDPALTEQLLRDAEGSDALPLLAFTLERLFVEYGADGDLRLDEYLALGGVRGSIKAAIDAAFADPGRAPAVPASAGEREGLLRRAFIPWLALVEPATGERKRRVARWQEIPNEARPLLDRLVAARLLVQDRRVMQGDGGEAEDIVVEIAHEALLRQWAALDGWLAEDAGALQQLEAVRRAAAEWRKNNRAQAWLVHAGARLTAAGEALRRADFDRLLGDEGRAYFRACRDRQRLQLERELRSVRRLRWLAAGLGLALVVAVFVGWEALRQRNATVVALASADAKERIASGRQLAAQSEVLRIESPRLLDRSTLLAVEAARRASGMEIDRSLRASVGLLPELLSEYTSAEPIQVVAVSPRGDWAAAGGDDGVVRVWSGGKETARIEHGAPVGSLVVTPDGRTLASASTKGAIVRDMESGHQVHLDAPDASVLAIGGGLLACGGAKDGQIRLWDVASGRTVRQLQLNGPPAAMAFSPDHRLLAAGGAENTLQVWDVTTGREVMRGKHEPASASMPLRLGSKDGGIFALAFLPNGKYVVSGGQDHTVRVWELSSGSEVFRAQQSDSIYSVAVSPDGHWLASGGMDETARVWSLEDGSERYRLQHKYVVQKVLWSTGGDLLTVSGDGTSRLWSMATGAELSRMYHSDFIHDAAVSTDGRQAITGDWHGVVRIWALSSGGAVLGLPHPDARHAVYSPDGAHLVTVGGKTAQLWQLPGGHPVHHFDHKSFVDAASFSPDGKRLVTAGWDGNAHLWDVATGQRLATLRHEGRIAHAMFSPDGRMIATAGIEDGTAGVWEVPSGRELFRLKHEGTLETLHGMFPRGGVRSLAFDTAGRTLATGGHDGTVRLWNLQDGRELRRFDQGGYVGDALFTPDDRFLIVDSDEAVYVWQLSTGERIAAIDKKTADDPFMSVLGVSPDGRWLLVASDKEHSVQVRTLPNLAMVARLLHDDMVFSGAFSKRGSTLLTAGRDKTARIWDTRTWQELTRVAAGDFMYSASYSPDERFFVTASGDGQVRVWAAGLESMVDTACQRLRRNLTQEEWRQYLGTSSLAPTCQHQAL